MGAIMGNGGRAFRSTGQMSIACAIVLVLVLAIVLVPEIVLVLAIVLVVAIVLVLAVVLVLALLCLCLSLCLCLWIEDYRLWGVKNEGFKKLKLVNH